MAIYTEAELKKMNKSELGELAEDFGFDTDEKHTKVELVSFILANQVEDDELDDDELDDPIEVGDSDEVDDDESELDDSLEDELDDEDEELDDEEPEPAPAPNKAKRAKKPDMHDGEETLAAKQVAALINTDPKTLRQFLRSPDSSHEAVGSGGRYEFLESDVDRIRNEFSAWMEKKTTRRSTPKGEGTPRKKKERVIPEEEIAPEIEELDDELDELLDDDFDDELED